ncbi:hypothetical protein HDU87_001134 [Geranomyces variabilis]|uniref:Uncharacterized protein n=1 Tax=Geranomyces variabilis TaxID=109894 RepID=A0AAD5TQ29_9FUNG|nr:hypothetical protein HDU87_001134 [Geranomyces variabilis]
MLVFVVQNVVHTALQELLPITNTLIEWIEHNKLDNSVECKLMQEALRCAAPRGGIDLYVLNYDELGPSTTDRASTTGMLYCSAPDSYTPNVNAQSTAWLKRHWVETSPPSILVYLVLQIDFASTGEAAPDQRRNPAGSICHNMCELMDLYLTAGRMRGTLDRGSYEQQNAKIWKILGT